MDQVVKKNRTITDQTPNDERMSPETRELLSVALDALKRASDAIAKDTNAVIGAGDIVSLIRYYNELDNFVDDLKKTRAPIQKARDSLSCEHIPEAFFNAGVKSPFRVDGVGNVIVAYRWSASTPDKAKGLAWLRANNCEGLFVEAVDGEKLSAFAKKRALAGDDLPGDVFTVSARPYTVIKKAPIETVRLDRRSRSRS